MRRLLLSAAVSTGLLLAGPALRTVEAGKGSSSGSRGSSSSSGRSYSSGSSSRSSSSSHSSSGRSYSSGSAASSSRTWTGGSSGSSARSSSSSTSAGSSKPSTGKSYGSGSPSRNGSHTPAATVGTSKSVGKKPSGSSYDAAAAEVERKVESKAAYSGKSYSSGSRPGVSSSPTASAAPGDGAPRAKSSPGNIAASGKTYSSGGTEASGLAGRKPSSGTYDSAAAMAQRKMESRAAFTKGQAPKTTYIDPAGTTRTLDARDRRLQSLRNQLDRERWVNRQWRQQQFYGPYYLQPMVVYHDPYSSFFWWWLLDQSLERQALWAYHHRTSMDDARYQALLSRNTQLESRVRNLETKEVKRDSTYAPEGVDADLMYDDSYVDAAYNPQPVPTVTVPAVATSGPSSKAGHPLLTLFLVMVFLSFAVWLVFVKRWGGTPY